MHSCCQAWASCSIFRLQAIRLSRLVQFAQESNAATPTKVSLMQMMQGKKPCSAADAGRRCGFKAHGKCSGPTYHRWCPRQVASRQGSQQMVQAAGRVKARGRALMREVVTERACCCCRHKPALQKAEACCCSCWTGCRRCTLRMLSAGRWGSHRPSAGPCKARRKQWIQGSA